MLPFPRVPHQSPSRSLTHPSREPGFSLFLERVQAFDPIGMFGTGRNAFTFAFHLRLETRLKRFVEKFLRPGEGVQGSSREAVCELSCGALYVLGLNHAVHQAPGKSLLGTDELIEC